MVSIKAKTSKRTDKTKVRIFATGSGADIVKEVYQIVTKLPEALGDKDPVLLMVLNEMLANFGNDEEEEADDAE